MLTLNVNTITSNVGDHLPGNGGYKFVNVTTESICEDVLYHTGKQA